VASDILALAALRSRRWLRAAADVVMPPLTLDQGRSAQPVQGGGLSAEAWGRITFLETPVCDRCGLALEYDAGSGASCAACARQAFAFDRARAAVLYDAHSRDLVLKLKHADQTELAGLFAAWLARAGRDLWEEADGLVPVPLHPWRMMSRRFNQAAEIARPLARLTGVRFLPGVLVRRRATQSQAEKSASARRRNVAGAFACPRRAWPLVEGKRLVLIDDVLTTGATADACARVLRAAGAARIDVAAVAKVKDEQRAPI